MQADVVIKEFGLPSLDGFAPFLREMRENCIKGPGGRTFGLSQSALAEAAGFDHSYVSRLESGGRFPTRDAVLKLAVAMKLDEHDRDGLLAAAGFMPGRIESLLNAEPVLSEALGFLQNHAVPVEVRDDVRNMIALLIRQAQRAAFSSPQRRNY